MFNSKNKLGFLILHLIQFNKYVKHYIIICESIFYSKVSQEISSYNPSGANAYVYLCSQNDQGGVVGIAWVFGTCQEQNYGYYKSSVNEYLRNDVETAAVSLSMIFNDTIKETGLLAC